MTRHSLALFWRIALTILLLALLVVLNALRGVPSAGAQSAGDPLVLAFYYLWYDENTWSYDRLSDLPAEPYVSSDRGAIGRQIDQARAAGIDALLAAWYGPGGGNPTESNLSAALEEANARGFRIGILFETNSPFLGGSGDVVAALQHALGVHAAQPAFLRVDGRPVLFFWRTQMYDVETWRAIRAQVDPGNTSIWIADGVDTSYLSVFDGHHLYSNTWSPPANLESVNSKFAAQVEGARQSTGTGKLWVATAMPGYDDTRARGGFAQPREDGAYYTRSWAAAVASRPNWVVITSFNEWPEGTSIEPSAAYGDLYLRLTATYAAQFKAGGGIPVALPPVQASLGETTSLPAAEAAQAAEAPSTPTLFVQTPLLNIRSGPGTEYPILNTASQGASLAITGRSDVAPEWWQVSVGGATGWVSGEFAQAAGPLDQVLVVDQPAASSAITATLAATLTLQTVTSTAAITPLQGAAAGAPMALPAHAVAGWKPILSPRP